MTRGLYMTIATERTSLGESHRKVLTMTGHCTLWGCSKVVGVGLLMVLIIIGGEPSLVIGNQKVCKVGSKVEKIYFFLIKFFILEIFSSN